MGDIVVHITEDIMKDAAVAKQQETVYIKKKKMCMKSEERVVHTSLKSSSTSCE